MKHFLAFIIVFCVVLFIAFVVFPNYIPWLFSNLGESVGESIRGGD